jgi:hypothetical protein
VSQPSASGRQHRRPYRGLRFAFGLLGLAVLLGGLASLGALPGGLVLVVILGGPLLLGYFFGVRSLAGSVLGGLAMLAVIIGTTLYVLDERASSTAALGYLALPVVGIPLVVVMALLDRAIRSPSLSAVASLALLAATAGIMLYLTHESAADSFCDNANGLGNTMIEVGLDPLSSSEAERLVAFYPDFLTDGQTLRKEGLIESAHVADVWAAALSNLRAADSHTERSAAYDHLRRVVKDLYGSTGRCPNIR